jgi:hypothetical protein
VIGSICIPLAIGNDVLEWLPILVLVALGVISSVVKKYAEQRAVSQNEEQAQRDREDGRLRRTLPQERKAPLADRAQRQAASPPPAARVGLTAPPQPPAPARTRVRRPPRLAHPPMQAPAPAASQPHETPDGGQIAKRRVESLDRRATLTRRHGETGIHPATELHQAPLIAELLDGIVSLRDAEALRTAIIYHEIFSPPKALRDRREPWEM